MSTLNCKNLEDGLITTFVEYLTSTAGKIVEARKTKNAFLGMNIRHKPVSDWRQLFYLIKHSQASNSNIYIACVFYQRRWRYVGGGLGAVSVASWNCRGSGLDWSRTSSSSLIEEKGTADLASLKPLREDVPPL